ncbi:DUF3955 domain-containing protein [Bacillus cereus]|uniref:DUF3955 domain-containing protein n=1 Tax=Bacillus cereus TaxID=1396 RepID=UPI0007AB3772|nr:DUF3955 domain-containing protein [Bacillus cereus]
MKNKYLLSLIPVFLGVICLIISQIVGTTIKPDGTLVEPAFFLIPVSYIFFFSGGISILCVVISSKLKKSK